MSLDWYVILAGLYLYCLDTILFRMHADNYCCVVFGYMHLSVHAQPDAKVATRFAINEIFYYFDIAVWYAIGFRIGVCNHIFGA